MIAHTPGPWTWRNVSGAGLQISGVPPVGFKFDGTALGADGKTSFMIWTVREAHTIQIADERWVQFSTGSWLEMQEANARLIAAAPELLAALTALRDAIRGLGAASNLNGREFVSLGIQVNDAIAKATGAA